MNRCTASESNAGSVRQTILVPQAPASTEPQTARLIQEPAASAPIVPDEADQETDIFKLSPVARAFPGQILLGVIFIGLAIGLAIRAQDFSWPRWVALVPLALGVLLLLLLWIRVKSCSYRLTDSTVIRPSRLAGKARE